MQLFLESPDFRFALRGADGASARVNDRTLRASFIVTPDQLDEAWPARDVRALSMADMAPLLALDPDVIVLGTGASQGFPPPDVLAGCLARGVGLESMTNAAAARTFNVLAGEGRRVVAGFLIDPVGPPPA